MVEEPSVQVEQSGGVLSVFLNRPHRLNAVNAALVDALLVALARAEDTSVRAVVLAGRGRAFCSGHDLKEDVSQERPEQTRRRLHRLQDVTRVIRDLDAPVVAAIHGHAIGAGAEFALACDLVVAARDTTLRFPETSLGLSLTNGSTRLLTEVVGPLRAKQLVLLGEPLDAEAAQAVGLVNLVVGADNLTASAHTWARSIAQQPPAAITLAKQALNHGLDADMAEVLDLEVAHGLATHEHAATGR